MKKSICFQAALFFLFTFFIAGTTAFAQTKHVVAPGESLSKIALKYYKDSGQWTRIYRANKDLIKDAEAIEVGWVLAIPTMDVQKERGADVEKSADTSTVRLVTGNDYPPFTDQKLPADGMLTEVVERAFETMGKEVELEFWSWKHGYEATMQGDFTATFPYLKNEKRMKDFYYSNKPLFTIVIYGFVRKDSGISYEKPEDLQGLTVCRPEGYSTTDIQQFLDKNILSLRQPEDMGTCFSLLEQGKVDIVSTNDFEAKGLMAKMFGSPDHFARLEKSFSDGELYLIFPKNNPKVLPLLYEFDQVFEKMSQDGTLSKITQRHMMYYFALVKEK